MIEKSKEIEGYIIKIRRIIHQNPELGYKEIKTSQLIKSELDKLGIPYKSGVAKTGVVATLKKGEGKIILLRADMDALPITEETNLPFASENNGVMHACGHDAHTAMLLGAAKLLKEEGFKGTIKFLFQPSEEGHYDDSDGLSGAIRCIKEGVLEGVDCALAMHQVPNLPLGTIGLKEGAVMAASDFFKIIINGKASHAGASPEEGIDAIVIASQLILALQTIVSREINARETGVVSVSTIQGGVSENIVAENVVLTGTIRALNEEIHQKIISLIQKKCEAFELMYDAKIEFILTSSYPVTENYPGLIPTVKKTAIKIFQEENVLDNIVTMGGEDFGHISQEIPSCFVLLGTMPADEPLFPLHNSRMTINEDALHKGTAFISQAALDILAESGINFYENRK